MTRPNLSLIAIHLAGNAALLWLGYYWLGVGESRTLTLLWSLVVALAIVCLGCVLHGAAFAWFTGGSSGLAGAFRTALRNLPAILIAVLALLALYALVARWTDASAQPAFKIASWLTLKLRRPVKPAAILGGFQMISQVIRWVILPVLCLPMISAIASDGWRGFARVGRIVGKLYWVKAPVLLLCGFWVPLRLMGWAPHGNFVLEILSLAARLLIAYLLFVGSCLLLALVTSAGKPVLSQSKATVSP